MKIIFLILIGLSPTILSAQEFQTLTFFTDDNERVVVLQDAQCEAYIDDTSNYRHERLPNGSLKVIGLGTSTRSATLLVDCPNASSVYSLKYVSRSVNSDLDRVAAVSRPDSSLAISARGKDIESRGMSIELSDRSFDLMQLTVRKSYDRAGRGIQITNSADAFHQLETSYFGYGQQHSVNGLDSNMTVRLSAGIAGLSFSHFQSRSYNREDGSEGTWFRTPNPIGIGFGHERTSKGKESRVLDRYFALRIGPIASSLSIRYSSIVAEDQSKSSLYQLRGEQSFRPFSILRISNANVISCAKPVACFVNEWGVKASASVPRAEFSMEYGLLPHQVAMSLNAEVLRRQKINLQFKKKFSQKSIVSRWRYFKEDLDAASTFDAAGLHLEYTQGKWTFFGDQSASILQRAMYSNSLGARYEGESLLVGFGGAFDVKRPRSPALYANIRYFFDRNLGSFALKNSKTLIKVKVKSNAPGRSVPGALVKLLQDGNIIAEKKSSPDGLVEFSEGRCCDEFKITVNANGFEENQSVYLTPLSITRSTSVIINDHRKIAVEYFVTENGREPSRVNVVNFYDEINEALLGCDGCSYAGNSIFVPIDGLVTLRVNQSLLPFAYQIEKDDTFEIDSRNENLKSVKVTLKRRG